MKKYFAFLRLMPLSFSLFGQNKLENSGNVGIGLLTPSVELEVNGRLLIRGSNLDLNGGLGDLSYLANTGKMLIGWNRSAGMGETNFISNQGPGGSGGFSFYNYDNAGSMHLLMLLNGNGNVGIGTNPANDRFAVDGRIKAREIVVTDMGWADHVFYHGYRLRPLNELNTFITRNKHLPGIPSAKQVSETGVQIGEMQAKLLEKIEELTLYLIAQESRLDLQAKEIKVQKQRNNSLAKEMKILNRHMGFPQHQSKKSPTKYLVKK